MQENNELNDIILNKGNASSNNKKIILAVATLGVILIIVVMLMNSLTSNGTDNLPQAVIPPEPKTQFSQQMQDEPLFEEVEVLEEEVQNNRNLDEIAKKLKAESFAETEVITQKKIVTKPVATKAKVVAKPKVVVNKATPKVKQTATTGNYYVQVGSFSKYEPNKKFLKSITNLGYNYRYHKIIRNSKPLNKVLVGPFSTQEKAKSARKVLRKKVESGAFLTKI